MLGFNERDLLAIAEDAGFEDLMLELRVEVRSHEPVRDWEALLGTAPNPLAPTWSEAIEAALEPTEAEQFLAHLRPLVEAGQGTWRMAESHLSARAPGSRSSNVTKRDYRRGGASAEMRSAGLFGDTQWPTSATILVQSPQPVLVL